MKLFSVYEHFYFWFIGLKNSSLPFIFLSYFLWLTRNYINARADHLSEEAITEVQITVSIDVPVPFRILGRLLEYAWILTNTHFYCCNLNV